MTTIVPVLLAGGRGTRLWPTSRKSYPKQFVDLIGSGSSFLQASLKRSQAIPNVCPWIIVTGEEYRFVVAQQAKETGEAIGSIILEPSARNTAPAIGLAAFKALALYDSPRLLVQTADHYISDLDAFGTVITQAYNSAAPFILFGVEPTRPETGYGYIEYGEQRGDIFLVSSFKEKPAADTAKAYLKSGKYLWNSGIFMLDARAYLEALAKFEPAVYFACNKAYANVEIDLDFERVDSDSFMRSPSISIDFAILERLENLHVIPYRGDWSDVGTWDSVANLLERDGAGNTIQGTGVLLNCKNTFIRSESRLVTVVGLENLIVIETPDAILVADATKMQDVKELVDILNVRNHKETTEHRKVYRPWGFYETLISGERFQVKQIVVNPKASLSLQMHYHRAEHWIIVSGTAEVLLDDEVRMLTEDQSIYIPVGSTHRLTNPSLSPITIIEVQSGSYLSEDDIVRLNDVYGR